MSERAGSVRRTCLTTRSAWLDDPRSGLLMPVWGKLGTDFAVLIAIAVHIHVQLPGLETLHLFGMSLAPAGTVQSPLAPLVSGMITGPFLTAAPT